MSATLTLTNFEDINFKQRSVLTADALHSSSSVALPISSSVGYAPGDLLVLGPLGTETCEVQMISSVIDATHVTVNLMKFDHLAQEPTVSVVGDQLKVFRAALVPGLITPPTDDQFTALIPTKPIALDQQQTIYFDNTGGENFWYKFVYCNSITGEQTDLAAAVARTLGLGNFYCSLQDIRAAAHMANNPFISDADIDTKRQEAQKEIDNALSGGYDTPFTPPFDPMISGITRLLAAGKLMMEDPGSAGSNSSLYQEGADKVDQAQQMIEMIDSRQYTLTNAAGQSIQDPNSKISKSFPNSMTDSLPAWQGGSERNFRMSDVQGYYGRKY